MKFEGKSQRIRERIELALPVRVQCRETLDREWMEMTRLIDVTPFGARFVVTRPTEPGRLLHLTLPMPRQLRCFDHTEQQYRVWALVRNVKQVESAKDSAISYAIGVAFIGKRPPASYDADPSKRFDVSHAPDNYGLWMLRELGTSEKERDPSSDDRGDTRIQMPLPVVLEIFDENGKIAQTESTVTENVSRRGAAVFSSLKVARGSFVRLTCSQYQISVVAAVRARRVGQDGIPRLHLEFVDRQWPIGQVDPS
jgi:hypothetical protein